MIRDHFKASYNIYKFKLALTQKQTYYIRMKINQLLSHFGTPDKVAKSLDVSVQAVYQWIHADRIPPLRQSDIEVRTAYKLKSEHTLQRLAKEREALREGDHATG